GPRFEARLPAHGPAPDHGGGRHPGGAGAGRRGALAGRRSTSAGRSQLRGCFPSVRRRTQLAAFHLRVRDRDPRPGSALVLRGNPAHGLVSAVVIWTLVLMGLGILALLTSRAVARDLGVQVERQSSLLATLSDLGEGLVITESGRFVAGNDAYVNLTGYSRDELAAMASLVDIAPEEQREQLAANLANRLSGRKVPARYTSALITKSGRRVEVEVAIHRVTTRRDQLLALVSDITERRRAEAGERESETRFRTLFQQAQAGMA